MRLHYAFEVQLFGSDLSSEGGDLNTHTNANEQPSQPFSLF